MALTIGSNMARLEIVCPNCRQVNRRGTDFVGRLVDPRQPSLCTVCGTNLRTGKRGASDVALGLMGWTATCFLNAFVGAGGSALLCVGIVLAWPEFFLSHPNASPILGMSFLIAGALLGLVQAERARRKGELHTHAKRAKESER